jgi:hypothetical protein
MKAPEMKRRNRSRSGARNTFASLVRVLAFGLAVPSS